MRPFRLLQSDTYRLRYSNFHRHKKHTDSGLIPGSVCFLHAEQKTGCLCKEMIYMFGFLEMAATVATVLNGLNSLLDDDDDD